MSPPGTVEQPHGTVSFLFSDIEGSTRLLQTLGSEQYAEVLGQHRVLLRQAFAGHDGYEVDCEGDQFFVAFQRASEALATAAEVQQALAREAWPDGNELRVRIGIHTGEPLLAPPKYVGLDVHKAARLMAAAHGGQVLVSQATRDLCARELPAGLALRDLGKHRLKDLTAPDRVHQLVVAGLPQDFPPPRTLTGTRVDLPAEPNRFVGRTRELDEVCAELGRDDLRLLTLTGPGGTGKTRLALRAAGRRAGSHGDGVRFVALAPVADAHELAPRIVHALGLSEQAGLAPEEVLRDYLAGRELLLVLDNLEHLLAGAGLLADLLNGCPGLQLLVTSREPLQLSAEREYAVPPLDEAEAVELFHERARAVKRDFTADGEVADICRRLDALPLAVELAAAHARSLTAAEILARLEARLPLLTGGPRDAPERQQTLRAAIDWSHDLLAPDEQMLFARLAVFVGGCTVEAAEAVCDADLDALAALVDKNLVRREGERFGMLETIHEYAAERLALSGEEDARRNRHAEHFLALARQLDATRRGPQWFKLVERFDHEAANVGVARGRLLDSRPAAALELAFPRDRHWISREGIAERVRVLEEALRRAPDASPRLRARALTWLGHTLTSAGHDEQGAASFEASLSLATKAGAEPEIGRALLGLRRYDDALALFRRLGDDDGTARALHRLGLQACECGDPVQGRKLLDESLALTRTVGDPTTLEFVLHSLADCALDQEVHDEAARLYHESLDIAARTNAFRVIADCLGGLAAVEACRGRPESAGRLWRAVRAFERESGYLPLAESERSRYERALSDVPLLAPATGAPWADVLADAIDYAGSLRAQQPTASSA